MDKEHTLRPAGGSPPGSPCTGKFAHRRSLRGQASQWGRSDQAFTPSPHSPHLEVGDGPQLVRRPETSAFSSSGESPEEKRGSKSSWSRKQDFPACPHLTSLAGSWNGGEKYTTKPTLPQVTDGKKS